MFNTRKLWVIAALVGVSGLAIAQNPMAPAAGSGFCYGDGTAGVKCPAANPGRLGHGCNNFADTGGAALSVSGTARVVQDTLVLLVRGLPSDTTVIYMQAPQARIFPKPFGNGIWCIDGPTTRLAVKKTAGPASRYPDAGEPGASVNGNISPGQTVYYQVMYNDRDFTPNRLIGVNFSNAWQTVWSL